MQGSRNRLAAAVLTMLVGLGACSDAPTAPGPSSAHTSDAAKPSPSSGSGNAQIFAGRAADSVLTALAARWSAAGDTHLTAILARIDLESRRTRDSALAAGSRPGFGPSYLIADGGGSGSTQVVLSPSTIPVQVISHTVDVTAGSQQGTVVGTATYQGTSVDITLNYSSKNGRDGSTPNPPRSASQHIAGYALPYCISGASTGTPSSYCNLVQTQKMTSVLDLPLPCEQTVSGSGSYIANVSLLASISAGIISIPFDWSASSSVANDIEKSTSSPQCVGPSAYFYFNGPTTQGNYNETVTEQTTASSINVSLNSTSQQGSTSITSYDWKANGTTIGTQPNFSWQASVGSWTIVLTVTDAAGLSNQAAAVLNVTNPGDQQQGTGTQGGSDPSPTYPEPSPTPDAPDTPPITIGNMVCQTTAQWVGRWDQGGQYYEEVTDCYPVAS